MNSDRRWRLARARNGAQELLSVLCIAVVVTASSRARAEQRREPRDQSALVSDARLEQAVDRRTVQRAALQRNPAVRVSEQRAMALSAAARAEGALPAPELMGQVWQVPFSHPSAFDSQMIMLGITQSFPAPGVLSAKEQAAAAQASEERAIADDKARTIVREVGRAFSDYLESFERYRVERDQVNATRHLVAVAEVRHSAGGPLIDLTRAQVDLARMQADALAEATLLASTKARLNALLAREPAAALGDPAESDPMVPVSELAALLSQAREARPELKQAQAQHEAKAHAARAAEREAAWPSFSAAALYFPPTSAMPQHGYGVSLSASLPWLWGAAGHRKDAEREALHAARTNLEAAHIPIDVEVVAAESSAKTAAIRLQVLRDRALPASRQSFEVARAGFETGRVDLTSVLDARRAAFEIEREVIAARADLDRALSDLEAAVGAEIQLRPLGSFNASQLEGGNDVP